MKYITYILLFVIVNIESKVVLLLTDGPIQRIGPRIYKKEILTNEYKDPNELAYDSSTRNLFFMYMDDILQNSGRAVVNVVTKETKKIEGISRNKATAVDPDTGDTYFGSDDGLYIYDPLTNTARNIGLYNVNIFKIVIRDNKIYLIDANNHMIYKVHRGNSVIKFGNVKTVIDFEIDGDNNVHFLTMCGLYCAVNSDEIIKNVDVNFATNFIVDGKRTYAITDDGIREIDCRNGTATKVADLSFTPRSIVFGDYGDIYYSENDSIYKLKPITSYRLYNVPKKKRV
ncbi:ommochrome-binding protein-like [Battus philenor]|uniref:ommochrome-binding protein-like n=1 Tax=Battus philenor TaxID=42288 RepID=UPI0035CFC705